MKHFLCKLLFWDAPAQGAFFGLTLLPAIVWFAFSFWCGIMVFNYALLLKSSVIAFLMIVAFGILGYVLVLELRMQILLRWKPTFRWKRIWIPLALCAMSLLYGAVVYFQDKMHWLLAMCGALVLGCLLWDFRFFAVSWKILAGTLAWIGALLVFWTTFAFAYEPFRSGTLHEMSTTLWIKGIIPFYEEIYRGFRLSTATGSFCFVLLGILLLVAGYLLFGSLLAEYAKIALRRMFCGAVRCVWGLVAGSYVVFLVLALWETAAYRRAVKDLETHFGHPLTSAELERQFYEGRPANPEFWKVLEELSNEYYASREEDERTYSRHPFAVLPESLHTKWKRNFLENASRQKLEQMISAPIPPPKRNYADDQLLMAMPYPELAELQEIARMEMLHIGFSLEDDDFDAVSYALDRMDACRDYLWKDHSYIAYLVGMAVTSLRMQAMEKILPSTLPKEKWLTAQFDELAEIEHQAEQLEKHFLFGESVCFLNLFHWLAHYSGMLHDFPLGLYFNSLRFLFPQGWWLAANEVKGMAKTIHVYQFTLLPQKATGYILTDLLLPALSRGTERKQSTIASCRVLRGLIQAELHKRRTGKYPDSLDDLPLDPFSGQPLKYRKGTCQIIEMVYKEKKEEDVENGELSDSCYIDYESNYAKRERMVEAVQIWSVGPDGIDDGGITNKPEYGSSEKKKDDIRFIIPIP